MGLLGVVIGECDWSRVAKDGDVDLSEIKENSGEEGKEERECEVISMHSWSYIATSEC